MQFWDAQHSARTLTRRLLWVFSLLVALAVAAVHGALWLAWQLMPGDWSLPGGFLATNVGVSLLLILGGWWLETDRLRAGGVALVQRAGGREARPLVSHAEQRLCNVAQELCIAARMPVPHIMVLPKVEAINAFAAGWSAQDAVVAVSQGALDFLSRNELQGMVAHELSHLHEGDVALKMRLAGMVYGLEMVYNFGQSLRERAGLGWWFGTAIMGAGLAGWIAARVLKAAVSRQREHLADARAVQWTRQVDGLGRVLRKIMTERQACTMAATAGLRLSSVQHLLLVELSQVSRLEHWLDSHPPLEERVRRIYGMPMLAVPLERQPLAPDREYRAHEQVLRSLDSAGPSGRSLAQLHDPFA